MYSHETISHLLPACFALMVVGPAVVAAAASWLASRWTVDTVAMERDVARTDAVIAVETARALVREAMSVEVHNARLAQAGAHDRARPFLPIALRHQAALIVAAVVASGVIDQIGGL